MRRRKIITKSPEISPGIVWLVLSATFYNAVLAVLNARGLTVSLSIVAATEILIILGALVFTLNKGLFEDDVIPLAYLLATLVITLFTCVVNKAAIIDYFRNILILFSFLLMGKWANTATIKRLFNIAILAVLIGLLFEIFFTDAYGDLFWPSLYFENTRGIDRFEFTDSKLFGNALGFEGRFSFGIISHRSSSLFLEQVSLANFAGVTMIYLLTLWPALTTRERLLSLATVVLILVTNDSRTMLIFAGVCLLGYAVFPLLPRLFALAIMPTILFAGLAVYLADPDAVGDTIPGRIALTMRTFSELQLADYLGFSAGKAANFADSGYIYVIAIGTIYGLILMWLFIGGYLACRTPEERRFIYSASILIFLNMLVSGTSMYSIKVAGLLWVLAGYFKQAGFAGEARSGTQGRSEKAAASHCAVKHLPRIRN